MINKYQLIIKAIIHRINHYTKIQIYNLTIRFHIVWHSAVFTGQEDLLMQHSAFIKCP
jgi:hypothetical protein